MLESSLLKTDIIKPEYKIDKQKKKEKKTNSIIKQKTSIVSLKNKELSALNSIEPTSKTTVISKEAETADLFNQSDVSFFKNNELYNNTELAEIVRIVKVKKILTNSKNERTFEEAILNYSPEGGCQNYLLNEVEILYKDLNLNPNIANKLKTIIISIKK